VPESAKPTAVKPAVARRPKLQAGKSEVKNPLVLAKDREKAAATVIQKRQSLKTVAKITAPIMEDKVHSTLADVDLKVDSAPEVAVFSVKTSGDVPSEDLSSQPTRIRIQVAEKPSQTERFEHIVEEVKQNAVKHNRVDDSIKVDFITIAR
jgi:hypothetical protein